MTCFIINAFFLRQIFYCNKQTLNQIPCATTLKNQTEFISTPVHINLVIAVKSFYMI